MHFILLRGLAREAAHWLEFPETLRRQLDDKCQVHCIDFPGCGKYHTAPALDSVSAMTDHARRELATRIEQPATSPIYLLGISMGGMVALDWAQRFPQELQGLVLINSSASNQPFWWRLRPRAWLTMLLALLLPPDQREALVLRNVSNHTVDYQQRLQQWLAIQRQHPITRNTIITMLRAAARFIPQITPFHNGLILASDNDRLVSVNASSALAQRFHWPLHIHPDAGHDLPMDDAHWVAMQIAQWLHKTD
jgi:pimeloyl-[acyl-carrier protein] methyl ester esterase